jgi:hypothetical protein
MTKSTFIKLFLAGFLLSISLPAWLQTKSNAPPPPQIPASEYGSGPMAAVQAATGAIGTGAVITVVTLGAAIVAAKSSSSSSTTNTTK